MGTVVIKDPPAITPTGHNGIKKNKRQDPPSLGAFDWGGGAGRLGEKRGAISQVGAKTLWLQMPLSDLEDRCGPSRREKGNPEQAEREDRGQHVGLLGF